MGISLWLLKVGLHWSTEDGFQTEKSDVVRLGLLGAIR